MKHNFLLLLIFFSLSCLIACSPSTTQDQMSDSSEESSDEDEEAEEDKSQRPSPPRSSGANVSGVNVAIDYSSPAVKGRKIFGELEPYGKVWRTGANEATIFSVDDSVKVNGETLPKGQYALFTIPTEGDWTVIFNKEPNQWGAYNYDAALDQLRLTITPEASSELTERLSFNVTEGGLLEFAWESVKFSLSVEPAR